MTKDKKGKKGRKDKGKVPVVPSSPNQGQGQGRLSSSIQAFPGGSSGPSAPLPPPQVIDPIQGAAGGREPDELFELFGGADGAGEPF